MKNKQTDNDDLVDKWYTRLMGCLLFILAVLLLITIGVGISDVF